MSRIASNGTPMHKSRAKGDTAKQPTVGVVVGEVVGEVVWEVVVCTVVSCSSTHGIQRKPQEVENTERNP